MLSRTHRSVAILIVLVGLLGVGALAQTIDVPGVGADGELNLANCTGDHVINLDLAIDGTWNDTATRPLRDSERPLWGGVGVYDKDKWAVVYDYTSVSIPAGCRVVFENHRANPPVVWMVQGNVTIDGEISLDGWNENNRSLSLPGPGGFRGGRGDYDSTLGGYGLGPAGGRQHGGGGYLGNANLDSESYGNARVLPLIGGSGGGRGSRDDFGGGAGGGAILIAADETVTISGSGNVHSRGGIASEGGNNSGGGGAGGAVRIVAGRLDVSGVVNVAKSDITRYGADGRIRFEAVTLDVGSSVAPEYTYQDLIQGSIAVLWVEDLPENDPKPRVWIEKIAEQTVDESTSEASFTLGQADVNLENPKSEPITVIIKTEDVPTPAAPNPWQVLLRAVKPTGGLRQEVFASFISTDEVTGISEWHAEIALKNGTSALQVRAYKP